MSQAGDRTKKDILFKQAFTLEIQGEAHSLATTFTPLHELAQVETKEGFLKKYSNKYK